MYHRKLRVRKEFAHLERQVDLNLIAQTEHNFIQGVLTGEPISGPGCQDQFRLLERIRLGHARRNRENQRNRYKKFQAVMARMRPEYAVYLAFKMLPGTNGRNSDMLRRLTAGALGADIRHTRTFFNVMETVHERECPLISPCLVDAQRARLEAATSAPVYSDRKEFESLLVPTPVSQLPSKILPFVSNDSDHLRAINPPCHEEENAA